MADTLKTDVLIVGAGIAGLMAAQVLRDHGIKSVMVDKGRSAGGRLATRRIGPGVADHGAQFFTVRTEEFQAYVDQWVSEGLVFEWSRGWSDGSLTVARDGHPRYAVRGGVNKLAKRLADGLDVRVSTRVKSLEVTASGWQARDENDALYIADGVLLTPPVPQSLEILQASAVELTAPDQQALEKITYDPSLTVMLWLDNSAGLPAPGAVQRHNANLYWIADNKRKGISPDAVVITAQASASYSRQLWEAPDERILSSLRVSLMPFFGEDMKIMEAQLKRWRYAQPTQVYPEPCLQAANLPPLVFAGDAFGAPRVEGAATSGLAAGHTLVEALR